MKVKVIPRSCLFVMTQVRTVFASSLAAGNLCSGASRYDELTMMQGAAL
jgi:hypothetical protein